MRVLADSSFRQRHYRYLLLHCDNIQDPGPSQVDWLDEFSWMPQKFVCFLVVLVTAAVRAFHGAWDTTETNSVFSESIWTSLHASGKKKASPSQEFPWKEAHENLTRHKGAGRTGSISSASIVSNIWHWWGRCLVHNPETTYRIQ